jgi:hypothetical protein
MSKFSLEEIAKRVVQITDESFNEFKHLNEFDPQFKKAILAACTINAQVLAKILYEYQLNQD